jgi:hypothetical protein
VDGHRPERFSLVEYTPPPPPEVRREPRTGRDYWDVELPGGIYRIYRERATGEWFADGIYD